MLNFQLITLRGIKFDQQVYEVQLPTTLGQITVLPNHMPLVCLAVPGTIAVRRSKQDSDQKLEYFATDGGVIEVNENQVRILTDDAVHADNIHEESIKKAMEEAKKAYDNAKNSAELEKAKAIIDRSEVRLNVAKYKRRTR